MGGEIATEPAARRSIFVSYSHKDEEWLERVRVFLAPRGAGGLGLDLWADTRIEAGSEWFAEIENALLASSHAVLLVSAAFLDSEFIWTHEIPKLIGLREQGHRIFWIPIKPSGVRGTQLGKLQAVWSPAKPLSTLSEPECDLALVKIAETIAGIVNR